MMRRILTIACVLAALARPAQAQLPHQSTGDLITPTLWNNLVDAANTSTTAAAALLPATSTITTTGSQTALPIPTGNGPLLIVSNSGSTLTLQGITAGDDGQLLLIASKGAGDVVLNNQDGAAAAANRIITGTGAAITLTAGVGKGLLAYDLGSTSWRVISPATTGMSNPSSATTGDLIIATATNVLGNLADVAAGSYLRAGGVGIVPAWSTLKLSNAATTGDLFSASASNTQANIAAVATGQLLISKGTSTLPAWSSTPAPQQSGDPANVGEHTYQTTTKSPKYKTDEGVSGLVYNVMRQTSIQGGDTVANTAGATNFATNYTIPTGTLTVGKTYRITARGSISGSGGGTITFTVTIGTSTVTGSSPTPSAGSAWTLTADMIVVTTGSGGTMELQGICDLSAAASSGLTVGLVNTGTVAVNTTTSNVVSVGVTWSVGSVSNTITMRQLIIDVAAL